ncbi:MAG: glycosyltransferase family 2 protein [Bacteroidaceae bacterium]|nr:glycosyltransferase family 2 protein [Bacteroidaceae bacterium]
MISVIIPAFNRQAYIEQCIRSALCQTYGDIEVIVVDDGSYDNTGLICDSLANEDARIKVIHQTNGGVSAARQAGTDCANGEWICFLDSDDTLPVNALENYSALFGKEPDIIVSGYSGELDVREFLLGITDYTICPALWGKVFKAAFLKAHMPYMSRELTVGEDMIANLVLGLNANRIATIQEMLYNVTLDNPTSVMNTSRKSFEYENYFFRLFDDLFLHKCKELPYYDELVRNAIILKLNGYKNVVLCGNSIDTSSAEWSRFLADIKESGLKVAPSDKLFLLMQNWQKLYGSIMNIYLRFRK